MSEIEKFEYDLVQENNRTIKQFFDRFYIIAKEPKGYNFTKEQRAFLEQCKLNPVDEAVKEGKNGYIVFRGKKRKILTEQQVKEIQDSNLSQRALAKIYGVSVATVNKAKQGKY